MNRRELRLSDLALPLGIVASIALASLLHYETVDVHPLLHEVTQRLYYLPIVYAAWRYGLPGGLAGGSIAVLFFLPHLKLHLHEPEVYHNQTAEMILFLLIGSVVGILSSAQKRERRRYEQAVDQLMLSDRLASLGQLSAGLVHEVRNPLASIKGAAEALDPEIPRGSRKREFLDAITSETDRLNKLIGEFLTFARPRNPELLPTRPNTVIRSVQSLVSKEAERLRLSLIAKPDDGVPEILMDGEQVKQALLNLVINAMHATPPGGSIELSTSFSDASVMMRVKDSGFGVPASIRDKLFTPFVTTKEGGTGLGLAIAFRLIEQHGGTIEVSDASSGGAIFEIVLPLRRAPQGSRVAAAAGTKIVAAGVR